MGARLNLGGVATKMKADESARQGATRDAASKKSTTSRDFWLLLQLCAALSLSIAVAAVAMGHSGALGRLGLVTHSELGTKLEAAHAALRAEMEELRARLKDHASQAERNAELDAIISKLLEEKRALHAQVEEWKLNATQCGGLVDKLRANKKALAKNYIAFQEENAALQVRSNGLGAFLPSCTCGRTHGLARRRMRKPASPLSRLSSRSQRLNRPNSGSLGSMLSTPILNPGGTRKNRNRQPSAWQVFFKCDSSVQI